MISLRRIEIKDFQQLSELFTLVYTTFDVGEKWNPKAADTYLHYIYDRNPDLAFLVEEEGVIFGAALSYIKPWWDGNYLFEGEVFVHPDLQKRGIGSQLLKKLFEEAIEKYDVTNWDASTFADREFPLRWYKSLGFNEVKNWVIIRGNIREALKRLP